MERNNQNKSNTKTSQVAEGALPKGKAQNENVDVKEGNSSEQRPEHGSDAGPNTSNRDQQLPLLDNGAKPTEDE